MRTVFLRPYVAAVALIVIGVRLQAFSIAAYEGETMFSRGPA